MKSKNSKLKIIGVISLVLIIVLGRMFSEMSRVNRENHQKDISTLSKKHKKFFAKGNQYYTNSIDKDDFQKANKQFKFHDDGKVHQIGPFYLELVVEKNEIPKKPLNPKKTGVLLHAYLYNALGKTVYPNNTVITFPDIPAPRISQMKLIGNGEFVLMVDDVSNVKKVKGTIYGNPFEYEIK